MQRERSKYAAKPIDPVELRLLVATEITVEGTKTFALSQGGFTKSLGAVPHRGGEVRAAVLQLSR